MFENFYLYKESVLREIQHTSSCFCQLACFNKSSFAVQYISSEIICLSNNFWLINIFNSLLNCSLFLFNVSFACTVFVISIPSFLNVLVCNYVFVHKYEITLWIMIDKSPSLTNKPYINFRFAEKNKNFLKKLLYYIKSKYIAYDFVFIKVCFTYNVWQYCFKFENFFKIRTIIVIIFRREYFISNIFVNSNTST